MCHLFTRRFPHSLALCDLEGSHSLLVLCEMALPVLMVVGGGWHGTWLGLKQLILLG